MTARATVFRLREFASRVACLFPALPVLSSFPFNLHYAVQVKKGTSLSYITYFLVLEFWDKSISSHTSFSLKCNAISKPSLVHSAYVRMYAYDIYKKTTNNRDYLEIKSVLFRSDFYAKSYIAIYLDWRPLVPYRYIIYRFIESSPIPPFWERKS